MHYNPLVNVHYSDFVSFVWYLFEPDIQVPITALEPDIQAPESVLYYFSHKSTLYALSICVFFVFSQFNMTYTY